MIFVPHLLCNPNQYNFLIAETFKVLLNNAAINPERLMSIECCFVEILQKCLLNSKFSLKQRFIQVYIPNSKSNHSLTKRISFYQNWHLSSRSRQLMSLDVAYCIVPWCQV